MRSPSRGGARLLLVVPGLVVPGLVVPGLVVLGLVVLGTAAIGAGPRTGAVASTRATARPGGQITVSAAASLTEAFTAIGRRFEKSHQGTEVTFNFDASSTLVLQIENGAPVDVFASADTASMDELVAEGDVSVAPVVFARNELEIAVKPGTAAEVDGLAGLAHVGVVSLCAREVPCGRYADAALAAAGVEIPADRITRGQNAKVAVTAVSAGDADAAVVYATDVEAAGSSVQGIPIPRSQNRIARYPIAPLAGSTNPATSKAFARYVASRAGRKILERHGFLEP